MTSTIPADDLTFFHQYSETELRYDGHSGGYIVRCTAPDPLVVTLDKWTVLAAARGIVSCAVNHGTRENSRHR